MNLINTDIKPDPFDPQTGDVYQYGAPFVQRLVVEDAPTHDDPRVRYRIDGGTDSNLTTVAQFHRHLAGLTGLRGIGRVRVVEQAAAHNSDAWTLAATGADNLARLSALIQTTCTRFSALADAVSPRGPRGPNEDARLIHAATNARQIADQVRSAIRLLGFEWDDSKPDALLEAVRAERKIASDLGMELDSISSLIAPYGVRIPAGFDGDKSTPTSLDLVRWLIVKSGIDLRGQQLTLPQVWGARDLPTCASSADSEAAKATVLAADASSLMVTRDALWSTLGAVSLGSLRVPTAATHLLDSLASVYGDRTAIPLTELIDAAFAFGICASRHPELPEIKCPASHGARIGHLDAAHNKVASINSLCPPGWRVGVSESGVAVFQPGETVPMTIMGDSEARVVAEIWRWHMQPVERRLAEFQNGLADILGWPVPQLHDPSGASDILVAVQAMFGTKTPWRHGRFKATADQLRLVASLEDSGSCNNVRSAEAMRTAAATIMELAAMLRSVDETVRADTVGDGSTLELLASLVQQCEAAHKLRVGVKAMLSAAKDDDESLLMAISDLHKMVGGALANAVGKGAIEAQRLGDIIEAHATVSSLKEALRIPDATDEKAIKWATYMGR